MVIGRRPPGIALMRVLMRVLPGPDPYRSAYFTRARAATSGVIGDA
jgi:hypothetical protein